MDRYLILSFFLFVLQLFSRLKTNPSVSFLGIESRFSSAQNETVVYVDPDICHVPHSSTSKVNTSIANVVGLFSYDFMLYYGTEIFFNCAN